MVIMNYYLKMHVICKCVLILCFRAFYTWILWFESVAWLQNLFSEARTFSVDNLFLKMADISFLILFSRHDCFDDFCARDCCGWHIGGGWAAEAAVTHVGGTFGAAAAQGEMTALMRAAIYGNTDCARLLLDAGADTNAECNVRARAGWWRVGWALALWWCLWCSWWYMVCEEAWHI